MTGTILRLASVFFILVVGLLSVTTSSRSSNNLLATTTAALPANELPATWEYRTLDAPTPQLLADQANKLGSESWEVVSVVQDLADSHHRWVAMLKRVRR